MLNYSNLTKDELLKLIADKDQAVMEYIYDKYSPALYGIILQKTNFSKEADGILIDTFIAFFKGKFDKSSLRRSFFMDLHNIAFNCIKKANVFYLTDSSADIPYLKQSPKYNQR